MAQKNRRATAVALLIALLALVAPQEPALAEPAVAKSHAGRWITDASGRVLIVHGINQVYKVPPYVPSTSGFDADDAAFLANNGFNAVRLGVIWAAVEPQPGVFDARYLNSIATTVKTLAARGIVSLLDFHQDLYNEKFQGEGAPAWAVQDGGLGNPAFGFPANYFANQAQQRAWDNFWRNAPGPDGVGLQDHYAAAWAHVASRFGRDSSILGYEIMNEPWPGAAWLPCAVPVLGCADFDVKLTAFYNRVTTAIRRVDTRTPVWFEPNVLLGESNTSRLGTVDDANTGFAFHVYCPSAAITGDYGLLCPALDDATFAAARAYATKHDIPELVTEFGATNDAATLAGVMDRADKDRIGWLEWAYTGNDITSSSPEGQALVLDPSKPPSGTNVNTAKLKVLAEPYPQLVAGTPSTWSFANGTFTLTYSTTRAGGRGSFPAGSETTIATPAIQYPDGYTVQVSGARVVSAPGDPITHIRSLAGAATVTVTISQPQ
jgi:endoglycosylceramidase